MNNQPTQTEQTQTEQTQTEQSTTEQTQTEQTQIEQTTNEHDQQNFLEHVNSVNKTYGHNKFQLQIEELNNQITSIKLLNEEKELHNSQLKKSIASLQTEIESKNIKIVELEEQYKTQRRLSEESDKTLIVEEQLKQIVSLQNEKHELCNKLREKDVTINDITSTLSSTNVKLSKLEGSLETMTSKFDEKVKDSAILQSTIDSLKNEINMKNNLIGSLNKELESLKTELSNIKFDMNVQETNLKTMSQQLEETENKLLQQLQPSQSVQQPVQERPSIQGRTRTGMGRRR
jgi:hypothetical protein